MLNCVNTPVPPVGVETMLFVGRINLSGSSEQLINTLPSVATRVYESQHVPLYFVQHAPTPDAVLTRFEHQLRLEHIEQSSTTLKVSQTLITLKLSRFNIFTTYT
ncbi:hypothetical protein P879_04560 [Paragonimus westermani]|uniref:Uncharacterized protein n=1 Tax=Paragonimus westermani TaxID=34504 RepID=A0A8T0DH29_9TREM|nr:hypothetical protein P879_04560 [Paragonimus westermani]